MRYLKYLCLSLLGVAFFGMPSSDPARHRCGAADRLQQNSKSVKRVGMLAKVRPEKVAVFKAQHAEFWPELADQLRKFHIQNYSIYVKELKPGEPFLFGFYEYVGDDYDADITKLRSDPKVRQWKQRVWDPCLVKSAPADSGVWRNMEEVFYFAGRDNVVVDDQQVQRYAMAIGVRPEMVEGYKQLHAHPWQGVLDKIREGNLRNYPIYLTQLGEEFYIFGYFEYVGNDFDADMKMIDSDSVTIAWMKFTDQACQLPLETREKGEWWATMEQIFYLR